MHEVVFSDARQKKKGVSTMDIAKRLIGLRFHSVHDGVSSDSCRRADDQPTESNRAGMRPVRGRDALNRGRSGDRSELVKTAPHSTRVSRLDDVTAARKPYCGGNPKQLPAQRLNASGCRRYPVVVLGPGVYVAGQPIS